MLTSPIKGDATLTDAQAADLAAGRWYFNVHTAAHAAGDSAPAGQYGSEAREVTGYFQKTFWDPKTGLYIRSATDHKPDYVWREAQATRLQLARAGVRLGWLLNTTLK